MVEPITFTVVADLQAGYDRELVALRTLVRRAAVQLRNLDHARPPARYALSVRPSGRTVQPGIRTHHQSARYTRRPPVNDNNARPPDCAAPMEPDSQEGRVTALPPAVQPVPTESVPIVSVPAPPDQNPAMVYLAAKPSAVGRRGLKRSLDRAAEILTGGLTKSALTVNWAEVRYQHVAALRALMIEAEAKPATINHTLAAVRGSLREAWRLGLIDAEVLARVADVGNVPAKTLPTGRHVDADEIAALFCACGNTPVGSRDAAMLALLYGCGVRRSEAVSVELADYDAGRVTIRHGKGRKDRIVYCPAGGREAIDLWIAHRGDWPGTLLCPVRKGGHVLRRGITDQAVLLRLRYLADQAGVTRFSPHDLRRSFVGTLLDAGVDISSVQQLAGHADVGTTAKYDRRPEDAKRRAAEKLRVPFVAPPLS